MRPARICFWGFFVSNRVSILSFFLLIRVSILSIFVLNRLSFLGRWTACAYVLRTKLQQIFLFTIVLHRVWFRVKCLKQGIKNRNSVLNRVGTSAIFVLNRVRVWGTGPHRPTQGYIEFSPPPPGCTHSLSLVRHCNGKAWWITDYLEAKHERTASSKT